MAAPVFTLAQISAQLQRQWGGADEGTTRTWNDGSLDYAMPDAAPNNNRANEASGFIVMTALQKAFAREAFELWDDLIQSNLTETTSQDAQITLAYSSMTTNGGTYTSAFLTPQAPGSSTFDREIDHQRAWMSSSAAGWPELQSANMAYGERGLETYIHEIGHALGLSHPGTYNAGDGSTYANAEYSQDTLQWTIMSYWAPGADGTVIDRSGPGTSDVNKDGINASTPLLHDIAAIQAKYGADVTTRTGDTVYGFNSNANRGAFNFNLNPNPVITIWDAGGNDRLDCSGFSQNQRIDLHAGAFCDVGALTLNVAIAYNVDIENASGGSGNDSITGNEGDNILNGLGGHDLLLGVGGADLLHGNEGNDTLNGGFGFVDTLYGDAGDDTYIVDDFDTIVEFFNNGVDTVRSSLRWVLGDNLENLILTGANSVNGFGNALNNVLIGNSGANYLQGFAGLDTLHGGAGNDIYELSQTTVINGGNTWDTVSEAIGKGVDTVYASADVGRYTYLLEANVENLIATGVSVFRLWGNELNNSLTGNGAANVMAGFDGNDTLDGKLGEDELTGGLGNDAYILNDTFTTNTFSILHYDTVIEGAAGGTDRIYVNSDAPSSAFSPGYTLGANIENGDVTGASSFYLRGNELNNSLTGNGAANVITGFNGNDTLAGKLGEDRLTGGLGNDAYVLDDTFTTNTFSLLRYDTVIEDAGGGTDRIYVNSDAPSSAFSPGYTLDANIENGDITGASSFYLRGNELNNRLTGNGAANMLDGKAGADVLIGGLGNDLYIVDNTGDAVTETSTLKTEIDRVNSSITYVLGANIENLFLIGAAVIHGKGNTLNNTLIGNGAINALNGGDGSDKLIGDSGADLLIGGTGKDTYLLKESVAATDTLRIAAGDSLVGGFDVADNFRLGTGGGSTTGVDKLDLAGTLIAANAAAVNGVDSGIIHSHRLVNGLISFDDVDNYAASLTLTAGNLSSVFSYLQGNITGGTVEFNGLGNTYVFQDGGINDTLVQLTGVSAGSLSTTGLAANALWIA